MHIAGQFDAPYFRYWLKSIRIIEKDQYMLFSVVLDLKSREPDFSPVWVLPGFMEESKRTFLFQIDKEKGPLLNPG